MPTPPPSAGPLRRAMMGLERLVIAVKSFAPGVETSDYEADLLDALMWPITSVSDIVECRGTAFTF